MHRGCYCYLWYRASVQAPIQASSLFPCPFLVIKTLQSD